MKVITITDREKYLFDILAEAQEEGVILETADGRQFVLISLGEWRGFDVGESDDFEEEVRATGENEELLAFLAERREGGERLSIREVKKLLGISE